MAYIKDFDLSIIAKETKERKWIDLGFFIRKSIKEPKFAVRLKSLLKYADVDISTQSPSVKKLRNKFIRCVTGIERYNVNRSICVQSYTDTDDELRYVYKLGAVALVTDHQIDDIPCIIVPSPKDTYAKMCNYYRNLRPNCDVTTVIGSIGKTTVSRLIHKVYESQYSTFGPYINNNILTNVGYYAQHLGQNDEKWVQEVAEDSAGYASSMSMIVNPKVVAITTINNSHFEEYGSSEAIVDEVLSITKYMKKDGVVIVNKDEFQWFDKIPNIKTVTISPSGNDADFSAQNITIKNDGLYFDVLEKSTQKSYPIHLHNIFAKHNIGCALYAFAAGVQEKIDYDNIIKAINNYRTTGIRQNIFDTSDNIKVYADCYNAIPLSVKSAVVACDNIPEIKGRRIVVLGDIAEAGDLTEKSHNDLCEIVNNSKFEIFVGQGQNINHAMKNFSFRENLKIINTSTPEETTKICKDLLSKDDFILFKGSHSAQLKNCIKELWPQEYNMIDYDEFHKHSLWNRRIRRQ